MNEHEFINYDLSNSYIPTEEGIIDVLDEINDVANNEPAKEVSMCELVVWWWIE